MASRQAKPRPQRPRRRPAATDLVHNLTIYLDNTPNGRKILIAAEEMGLDYELRWLNLDRGDQFKPDFVAISPNARIPAITETEGPDGAPMAMFESGAILLYLARRTGRFGAATPRQQFTIEQWLMWQMGSVGPMAGQAEHFFQTAPRRAPDSDHRYAQDRYRAEVARLYRVLDTQLSGQDYMTGPEPTIADFATFPWVTGYRRYGQDLAGLGNLKGWMVRMAARPGVARGLAIAAQGPGGALHLTRH